MTAHTRKPSLLALLVAVAGLACSSDGGSHASGTSPGNVLVSPPPGPSATSADSNPAGPGALPPGSAGSDGSGVSTPPAGSAGAAGMEAADGSSGSDVDNHPDATAMVDAGGDDPVVDAGTGTTTTAAAALPSAGCSAGSGRPAGGTLTQPGVHYIAFPEGYDGTKPYPVLMGFHGCGGVNRGTSINDTEWMRLTRGTRLEDDYVQVVPLSSDTGGCWNYGVDIARVKATYDTLLADHCVDTSRVFATGHSSGAQLIVQIVLQQHAGDAQYLDFRALAPVAASDYGAIAGPVPVMYIQGQMDKERGNGDGHETVERFRAANSCGDSSMPYAQVASCQSGSTQVDPGCVAYDDCQAPTVWCSHNDPAYSGTMHGVPCFAMDAMYDFFSSFD